MFDLEPATTEMTGLIVGVRDDQLQQPTACDEWTVGQLLAHIHQFTSVFADSADRLDRIVAQAGRDPRWA